MGDELQNKEIKESLFTDGALLTRIIDAHKHNEEALKQPKSCRKGYMGQLRLISNLIQKQASSEEWMHAYTQGEDWVTFCDTYLAELNDMNDGRQLGRSRINGMGPQSDGEEEDDLAAIPLDSNFEFLVLQCCRWLLLRCSKFNRNIEFSSKCKHRKIKS